MLPLWLQSSPGKIRSQRTDTESCNSADLSEPEGVHTTHNPVLLQWLMVFIVMVVCSPSLGMRLCMEGRLSAECGRAGFQRLKWILQNNVKHTLISLPDNHRDLLSSSQKMTLKTSKARQTWLNGRYPGVIDSKRPGGLWISGYLVVRCWIHLFVPREQQRVEQQTLQTHWRGFCVCRLLSGFYIIAGLNRITLILITRGWRT